MHDEYDELMAEAVPANSPKVTAEHARRVLELLTDAAQAGRPWAEKMLDDDQLRGCQLRAKSWWRKNNTVAFRSHDGKLLTKAAAGGVKRLDPETGETNSHFEQTLFDSMSTEQLREHIRALVSEQESRAARIEAEVRLLVICEKHPDAFGPADACARENTTIEAVLGSVEDAA